MSTSEIQGIIFQCRIINRYFYFFIVMAVLIDLYRYKMNLQWGNFFQRRPDFFSNGVTAGQYSGYKNFFFAGVVFINLPGNAADLSVNLLTVEQQGLILHAASIRID